MAYRRILTPLRGTAADTHVLKAAFEIATAFGSHVAGVYVKPDPRAILRYLGKNVSARMMQEIVDAASDDAKHAGEAAHAALNQAARAADAPVELPAKARAGIGASFRLLAPTVEQAITTEARLADLSIFNLAGDASDMEMRTALESVLLNGRKPLLLVPNRPAAIVGAKVAIGWDDSTAAANAVSSAVPLLKRAEAIEILNVASGAMNTVQMDRVSDYLWLHGQRAVEHSINPGSQEVAAALLEAAESSGAGLLVIGGYGHSRLRELVLGGVTRYVFANATVPIFMAH